jgi:molybdopterin synthase sulfur carrier subunit
MKAHTLKVGCAFRAEMKGDESMPLKVTIPTALRKITGDADAVEVAPGTVREIIATIDRAYPGFRSRVCEDDGRLRRFINVYVDGEDIRFLDDLATRVNEGSEVSIVLAIAGG